MIVAAFVVFCGIGIALSQEIVMPATWEEFTIRHHSMENLFASYKKLFNKSFPSKDIEKERFEIFVGRVKSIFDWNDAKNEHKRTFLKGINRFSDMTVDERKKFVMPETKAEVGFLSYKFK